MTQRKQTILAYSVATMLFVCSGFLWSTVLGTPSVQWGMQPDRTASVLPLLQNPTVTSAIETTRTLRPTAADHAAASGEDDGVQDPPSGEEGSTPPTEVSQEEDDLTHWGIERRFELTIPSLALRVPVYLPERTFWDRQDWAMLEEQMQIGLLHGAAAYPHSALPGEQGALIIAGHSSPPDDRAKGSAFGRIFERLSDLVRGDSVTISDHTLAFGYRVTGTMIVDAKSTDILRQETGKNLLKLITCYPVGSDAQRLVVIAEEM
ncbi:MAG: sortase [Candidatus Peregrinibacteria bacterium]